jgi:hypothetical protein
MLELQEQYRDLSISRADDVYSGATDIYERYYKVADYDSFPSVTTVLEMIAKPALRDWKMNRALDYLGAELKKTPWDKMRERIWLPWTRYPKSKTAQRFKRGPIGSWERVLAFYRKQAKLHPDRIRDEAGYLGSEIHDAIHAEISGFPFEFTPPDGISEKDLSKWYRQADTALQSYRMWREDSTIVPLWTERTVWSLEYGYAGSADMVGMDGSKVVVLDWKTGSGVHNEAGLQVAAYAHAIEELTSQNIDECRVVHLDKTTPAWTEYTVKDWRRSFNGFLSALNTWKLWHDGVFTSNDS